MKAILLTISLFFFSFTNAQNKQQGIKIYIKMEFESDCFRKQKFYSSEEKGIVFNNQCKKGNSFLFSDDKKSDTLTINELRAYKISSIEEIKKTEQEWRTEKFKDVQEKNKKEGGHSLPIHTFDKNYIFDTYIIEIISDEKFVIYPVKWRGQGIKQ